jgi:hypothetical protein
MIPESLAAGYATSTAPATLLGTDTDTTSGINTLQGNR